MSNREKAKRLYLSGKKLKEIAAELDVKYDTVRQWKVRDKWPKAVSQKSDKGCHKISRKKRAENILGDIERESIKNDALIPAPLNFQQQLFCEIYVSNFNAGQAYLNVYHCNPNSARVNGHKLLTNANVRTYIKYLKYLKAQAIMVDETDLVQKYMEIAFADYTDFVDFGTEKHVTVDEKDMQVQYKNYVHLKDSNMVDGGVIEEVHIGKEGAVLKLSDRMKALEWLSKYFEMNPMDKHKVEYDSKKQKLDRLEYERRKKHDESHDF